MVAEKFQIYSVWLTANTFVSQKFESVHFYSCPQLKVFPRFVFILPQADGNYPFHPFQRFLKMLSSEEKGCRIMKLKKLPKLTKVLFTSFDKFRYLCNLYIFGLCFVIQ